MSDVTQILNAIEGGDTDSQQNDRILNIPKSNASFLQALNRDLDYAGIEKTDDMDRVIDLHALRHSFISLMAREGVHPHVLQRVARHSNIQTTLKFYTHLLHGDDTRAIGAIGIDKFQD